MKKPGLLLFLLILTMIALSGFREGRANTIPALEGQTVETWKVPMEGGVSYTNVNPAGLAMMLNNKDFLFINVHIPYEGEIKGTDLFIPYNEIEQNIDKLPANKDAKIFLYCRTDRMSNIAARTLVKMGYTNVWHLDGGMISWEKAGYTLIYKR